MAQKPKINASKAAWSKFIADEYPDVDQTGMNRKDLQDVHKLQSSSDAAQEITASDVNKAARAADPDALPDISQIPKDLQFSTDTGEDREIERTPFALDGIPFWLYRPSDAALTLYTNQLLSDDARARTNAMVVLVQQALDTSGMMYVQERITDKANNFDDSLYGQVVAAVLIKWGEATAAAKFKQIETAEATNRKQRRAATAAAGKKK